MSSLDAFYLQQLQQRENDEVDRLIQERLRMARQASPKPTSSAQSGGGELSLGQEFWYGIARGGAHTVGSLGTFLKAGGALVGSDLLKSAGENVASYWAQTAAGFAPSKEATGSLWDDPWLVLNPHWLTANVAESLPSLAASMIPAGAAGKALMIGGKAIGWSPAVALKLARIGAAVTGGAIGGGLEGASTYEEVKRRGGSDEEALKALAFMGLASAGLNAISLGQAFKVANVPGAKAALKRAGIAGVSEGLTEWLEEPTEAVILGEDWQGIMEAAKRGLNVIPGAAISGGMANVATQKVGELPEAHRRAVGKAREAMGAPLAAVVGPGEIGKPPMLPATKVVDDQGQPKRVYHGSVYAFEKFKATEADQGALYGPGLYFTEDPQVASGYAESKQGRVEVPSANVRPAYLEIVNPFDVDAPASHEVIEQIARERGWDLQPATNRSGQPLDAYQRLLVTANDHGVDRGGVTEILKNAGYDGITHIGGKITGGDPHRVWIAFDPGQVIEPFERTPVMAGGLDDPGASGQQPPTGQATTSEQQGPQPGDKLTVNLKYVDGTREFKNLTAAVNQANTERMAADRATRSVGEMMSEGMSRLPTVEAALEWNPETAPASELPGTLRALARWRDTATKHFEDLLVQAEQGEEGAKWDAYRAFTLAGHLAANVELGESIAGRTMRMQQEASTLVTGFDKAELIQMADAMRDTSDINVDAFVARMAALRTRGQRRLAAKQSVNLMRSGQNALYEAWINGLLSGPQTHIVNPASNALTTLWAIPERALAAQFHTGVDTSVVKGEATAMLRGMVEGFIDGLRIARHAWRDFEGTTDTTGFLQGTKLDIPKRAITSGAFGQDPNAGVGRAIDYIGQGVRFPTRFMAATDAFFKAVNYRMELKALALREAVAEGLDGRALVERVLQIEANPPAEVKQRAQEFMLLQTFQNELGEAGQNFMSALNAIPGARLVLPFIKTPTNIAKWTIYRTPGLNMLSKQFRADLATPGPTRDLALARASMGAMVGASIAALTGAGLITGGGPADPDLKREMRDMGWQPYSIKVGDTYYAYNRLDPIGALIALIADTTEILAQVPSVQADTLAAAGVLALSKTMVNKTYLQGLSDALEAVSNPERGAQKYVQRFAQTLIPTGVRQIERTIDPTVREARSVLTSVQSVVPGWSSSLPPRRNIFGEPIIPQGGWGPDIISPIYTTSMKEDIVSSEIARNRVNLSMPSKVLEGRRAPMLGQPARIEGVELSPQEYDQYVRMAGEGLRNELARLMQTPGYAAQTDGPDGGKALMIRHTVFAYRSAARARLLAENEPVQTRHFEYLNRRSRALIESLGR